MLKGIDVSTHQGVINWDKVKAAGIEFAMLRAGYGRNNIDKQFKRNIEECNRLGIPAGVYWFSYALSEADAAREAESVLNLIKPYRIEYPVVYDLEYDTLRYARDHGVIIDKALASKMVRAFCEKIEAAGYYAMNYANLDYTRNMFEPDLRQKYDLWYAQYSSAISKEIGQVNLWQYSDKGSVDGIAGNVDMNYDYRNYKALITKLGLNNLKAQETQEKTPEVIQVSTVLKQGSKGPEVKVIQEILNRDGHGLATDGDFGKGTKAAVIAFQKKNKLTADGVVGPQTQAALKKLQARKYRVEKPDKQTVLIRVKKADVAKLDVLDSKGSFETVRSMRARQMTKPDLIFNGGLYNTGDGASGSAFTDEGKVITQGFYSKFSLLVDNAGAIRFGYPDANTRDRLGSSPSLIANGQVFMDRTGLGDAFLTTRHPRTAFAETADEYIIVMVHGRKPLKFHRGVTILELIAIMQKLGAINAINLDGGGSSIVLGDDGQPINEPLENRGIDNSVCIYLK